MVDTPHLPSSKISKLVGTEVKAWLSRRGISASAAARELGWTQNYISRRITGAHPLDVVDLARLSELLDVPIQAFFPRRDIALMIGTEGLINRIKTAPPYLPTWRRSRSDATYRQVVPSPVSDVA